MCLDFELRTLLFVLSVCGLYSSSGSSLAAIKRTVQHLFISVFIMLLRLFSALLSALLVAL